MPKAIRKIDWQTIEKLYRLGQFSIRMIAKQHGIAASTISRRAKKEEWVQDKSEEVAQRTRLALIAQRERNTLTREDIEVAVQTNIAIVRSHRRALDFQRGIGAQLAEALDKNHPKKVVTKDGQIVFIPMSLLERSVILRNLAQAAKIYIPLEREAFSLNETPIENPDKKRFVIDDEDQEMEILARELIKRRYRRKRGTEND